jgi:hypothetical protein
MKGRTRKNSVLTRTQVISVKLSQKQHELYRRQHSITSYGKISVRRGRTGGVTRKFQQVPEFTRLNKFCLELYCRVQFLCT